MSILVTVDLVYLK